MIKKTSVSQYKIEKEVNLCKHMFYLGDVFECFKKIEPNTIDLVFTSPPYNVGINYERIYPNFKK
jgi:DNA modification methylase